MFTGLVEELGEVVRLRPVEGGVEVEVRAPHCCEGLAVGDSIAVDGVCLTAATLADGVLTAAVSPETLARSNMADYETGTRVNLERPLAVGARLGGHFVQGHVDAVTRTLATRDEGEFLRATYELPPELGRLLVEKGSVALNGVSLTVASLDEKTFDVQLVPHTLERTNLISEQRPATMNVEVDILGKYVARLLGVRGDGAATDGAGDVAGIGTLETPPDEREAR